MKKILFLIIAFFGLIGFGYCDTILYSCENCYPSSIDLQGTYYGDICVDVKYIASNNTNWIRVYYSSTANTMYPSIGFGSTVKPNEFTGNCMSVSNGLSNMVLGGANAISSFEYFKVYQRSPCPVCQEQYTSLECQEEYSLMPISSCDSEYCGLNGLCPVYTGDVMSQLYINGIEHLSAPMINITIPMEVQRNYEYTGVNEDIFDLDIGSEQGDENYIQGIIDVNSYRPSSDDFKQSFVGGLTLIFPYIIITAFVLFIRRFIRKIFK